MKYLAVNYEENVSNMGVMAVNMTHFFKVMASFICWLNTINFIVLQTNISTMKSWPGQLNFREHGADRPSFHGKQKKMKKGTKIWICKKS